MRPAGIGLALLLALPAPAVAQEPPPDASDLVNVLLAGFLGFRDMTGPELQKEVAELGGVPFRSDVPVEFMDRRELPRYLKELVDSEYPASRASADARTLAAFDLLSPGADLRELRSRLLEENVAGFYDERPGRKKLYAISADKHLTPANQLVMAHEMRHALQDQYMDVHHSLDDSVSDFDDRRLAFMSLLEGDATLLMERFLLRRLPAGEEGAEKSESGKNSEDLRDLSMLAPSIEGVPPVLRDQLVLPYTTGLEFTRFLFRAGGWARVKQAWDRPPLSTEQVLHPEKYVAGERPLAVAIAYAPSGGRLLNQGVLGEMLLNTLLADETGADETEADGAQGWGGDAFRLFDLSGKTLLVWRCVWDTPDAAERFRPAILSRFQRKHGNGSPLGAFTVFGKGPWRFALRAAAGSALLVSSDDEAALSAAVASLSKQGS